MKTFLNVLLLVAVLFVGYLLVPDGINSSVSTDKLVVSGNTFTVQDSDSSAFFRYNITATESKLSGSFFQYSEGSGTVETLGRMMVISYLTDSGYRAFKSQYNGDISRCPAPFLQTNTKTAHLFPADRIVAADLKKLMNSITSGKESVDFSFTGRTMTFKEAQAKKRQVTHWQLWRSEIISS